MMRRLIVGWLWPEIERRRAERADAIMDEAVAVLGVPNRLVLSDAQVAALRARTG